MMNQRGQTILEMAISFPLLICSMVYFLHLFIKVVLMIAANDAMESFLLCRMTSATTQNICRQKLLDKLSLLNLEVGSVTEQISANTRKISIQVQNDIMTARTWERQARATLR